MKKKLIIVNNQDEYIKFIKKLKYYKSIIYINTLFELKGSFNNKNLHPIIKALNIKRRKKRIEYIYDESCNIIDNNFKDCNICGFKNSKCYIQRKKNNNYINGCCRMCPYQSKNGCPTKNLACKLFNCTEVKQRYKTFSYKDLDILRLLSIKNRLIVKSDYFSKREDVLKDLYSISFIYSLLRIIYRLTKIFIF